MGRWVVRGCFGVGEEIYAYYDYSLIGVRNVQLCTYGCFSSRERSLNF